MEPVYGIIGCGNISRFHFNGLIKAGAKIGMICDLNKNAAQPWIDKTGARFTTDYNEVIVDKNITAIAVLTSSQYHFDICTKAIKAGKDIICEKTMMNTAEEAYKTAVMVKKSKSLFFTAFMKRFFPAVQKAKELLPGIGKIFSSHIRSYQPWGDIISAETPDNYQWIIKNYGGAIVKCAGSHALDLSLFLLGRPDSVYANIDYIPGSAIDRRATALLEYTGGAVAHFETVGHPLKGIGYEKNGWDEKIEINGSAGRLELATVIWDTPENNGVWLTHYDNERRCATEYRFAAMNPFDAQADFFHKCFVSRTQGHPDVTDGFNTDWLISQIFESAAQKKSIKIDWQGI